MATSTHDALAVVRRVTAAVRNLETAREETELAVRELALLIRSEPDLVDDEIREAILGKADLLANYCQYQGNESAFEFPVVERDASRMTSLAEAALFGLDESCFPRPARELLRFHREFIAEGVADLEEELTDA